MRAEHVDILTPDGTADAFVVRPDEGGPYPGVVLHMDAIGLRPNLEQLATRFAGHGYVVLVPNCFYRGGRAPLISMEELLAQPRNDETMARLMGLIGTMTPEAAETDAKAWVGFLAEQPDVSDGPMAAIGYCMGGALAMRTGAAFPDRVKAVASLHGGNLASDKDTSPHLLLPQVTAELYFGHAPNDHSMPQEQIDRLEAALDEQGLTYVSEMYEGAVHGWTQADTPMYNEAAGEKHVEKVLDLLSRTL